jgi:hypothetical protein
MTAADWVLAVTAAAVAGFLAWAVPRAARDLRAQWRANRPLPPLPQRTRTPDGLPRDGHFLTWGETQAWNAMLREYGPDEPAWPGRGRGAAG